MKGSAKVKQAEPVEVPDEEGRTEDADLEHDQTEPGDAPDVPSEDKRKDKAKPEKQPPLPSDLRRIQDAENADLADWLSTIGPQGSYRVQVSRAKPETWRDPVTNEEHSIKGHLTTLNESISEDQLKRDYGGGVYELRVTKKNNRGSFVYEAHRVVTISGDPKFARAVQSPAASATTATDSAGEVVRAALSMTKDLAEKSAALAARPQGIDPAMRLLLDQMKDQNAAQAQELLAMRAELATVRNKEPPRDEFRDKMLDKLVDGDSARITALRTQHESEIRQLKENHAAEVRRLEDRADRAASEARAQSDRQLDNQRASYEREIAALKGSNEVTLAATKSTFEVQVHTLNGEIKRLERDNAELRDDIKELRSRKDKTLIETMKEVKTIREALNDGEEGEVSTIARVVEAAGPLVMGAVEKFTAGRGPAPAQPGSPAAPVQAQVRPIRPRIARAPNGQVVQVNPDGSMIPVRKKPKVITTDAGNQVELPEMEAGQVKMLVEYLEKAFVNGVEPAVLAQSAGAMVPPPIISWIKDNTTEDASGVDLFMKKVANLSGSSPLANLNGKKWLRKVGQALIGNTTSDEEPEPAPSSFPGESRG